MGSRDDSPLGYQRQIDQHFDAVAQYWKELYEQDTLFGVIHQQRRMLALRWLDECVLAAGSHVLDIGCGAGILAVDLARRGHVVDGLDTSRTMIELANQVVAHAGVADRVRLQVGDAHKLPFESKTFDFAIALGVLPYLHTPEIALSEMARVLKPAGHVVVSSDNLLRLNHVLDPRYTPVFAPMRRAVKGALVRLGHPPQALPARRLTSKWLRRLMGNAELDVVKRQTLGFGPFSFLGWELIPDQVGLRLHRRLQQAADRGVPILAASGAQVLVLARRGPARAQVS